MIRFLLGLVALIAGCTTIDYQRGPVPGLEHMTVEEHYVDATEIYDRCSRCGHLGFELPTACTCVYFRTNRAVIWLPRGASRATIEHERAHAQGYDHTGGDLRSRYAAWMRNGSKAASAKGPADAGGAGPTQVSTLKPALPAE